MSEPRSLGLFLLDTVLLPGQRAALHVFEPRYRQLFADCVLDDRPFVVLRSNEHRQAAVGCSARFARLDRRFADGRLTVTVRGLGPVEIGDEIGDGLYFAAETTPLVDVAHAADPDLIARTTATYGDYSESAGGERLPPPRVEAPLSYAIAQALPLDTDAAQDLLEERNESVRLLALIAMMESDAPAAERRRLAAERAPRNGKVPH